MGAGEAGGLSGTPCRPALNWFSPGGPTPPGRPRPRRLSDSPQSQALRSQARAVGHTVAQRPLHLGGGSGTCPCALRSVGLARPISYPSLTSAPGGAALRSGQVTWAPVRLGVPQECLRSLIHVCSFQRISSLPSRGVFLIAAGCRRGSFPFSSSYPHSQIVYVWGPG